MKSIKSSSIMCLFAAYTIISANTTQAAEQKLSPSEIKNLRYLSNAVLVSRVHERKRAEADIKADRDILQSVHDSVSELHKNVKGDVYISNISSEVQSTNAEITGSSAADNSTDVSKASEDNRKKYLTRAIADINNARTQIESNKAPRWKFWEKKTANDEQKNRITKLLLESSEQLSRLVNTPDVDPNEVKIVLDRLALKKLDIKVKPTNEAPTLSTRTTHRRQGVSK